MPLRKRGVELPIWIGSNLRLIPDQPMANSISGRISKTLARPPPFAPYRLADFLAPPLLASDSEQVRIQENWAARQPVDGFEKPKSFRSGIIAHLLCVLAAHLCGGGGDFRGFDGHLNLLRVILHVVLLENPGAAMVRAKLSKDRAEHLARDRDTRLDFLAMYSIE